MMITAASMQRRIGSDPTANLVVRRGERGSVADPGMVTDHRNAALCIT